MKESEISGDMPHDAIIIEMGDSDDAKDSEADSQVTKGWLFRDHYDYHSHAFKNCLFIAPQYTRIYFHTETKKRRSNHRLSGRVS